MTVPPPLNDDAIDVTSLFVTPLIRVAVPDAAALNEDLRARILGRRPHDAGAQLSNRGGWQSHGDFAGWCGPRGAALIDLVKALANRMSALHDPAEGLFEADVDWFCSAWANVNEAGDLNAPHTHPGAYWSAVYYVDDGRDGDDAAIGGELELMDPRGAMPNMLAPDLKIRLAGCLNAGLSHSFSPRAGDLVMFPSWLMHSVRPYRGSRSRISIAFNLALPLVKAPAAP